MNSNLDRFRNGHVQAVARAKAQPSKQHVQHAVHVQKVDGNVITTTSNIIATTTKTTTAKLSDEQYRTTILSKALAYLSKRKAE